VSELSGILNSLPQFENSGVELGLNALRGAPSQHLRNHSGGEFRGSTNEPPSFTCCVDGDWETAPVARISGAGAVSLSNAFSRLCIAMQNMWRGRYPCGSISQRPQTLQRGQWSNEEEGIGFVGLQGIVSIEEKTLSRYRDTRSLIGSF
jgi:hypothetical protein